MRSVRAWLGGGDISSKTGRATDGQDSESISFLSETDPGVRKISRDHISRCTLIVDLKAN